MLLSTTDVLYTIYTFIMAPTLFIRLLLPCHTNMHILATTCDIILYLATIRQTTALLHQYTKEKVVCIALHATMEAPISFYHLLPLHSSSVCHDHAGTASGSKWVSVHAISRQKYKSVCMCTQFLIMVRSYHASICIGCLRSTQSLSIVLPCFFFLCLI